MVAPDVHEFDYVAWQVRADMPSSQAVFVGWVAELRPGFCARGRQVRAERSKRTVSCGSMVPNRRQADARVPLRLRLVGRIVTVSVMMFDTLSCVYSAAPPTSLQCDQDAYACTGQKCSAQSIVFMHDNWAEAGESN